MHHDSSHHPYSTTLRQRSGHLCALAADIERAAVMSLGDAIDRAGWSTRRARLCDEMLAANLRQLHQAADDLRTTAFRYRQRADELDRAHRSVA